MFSYINMIVLGKKYPCKNIQLYNALDWRAIIEIFRGWKWSSLSSSSRSCSSVSWEHRTSTMAWMTRKAWRQRRRTHSGEKRNISYSGTTRLGGRFFKGNWKVNHAQRNSTTLYAALVTLNPFYTDPNIFHLWIVGMELCSRKTSTSTGIHLRICTHYPWGARNKKMVVGRSEYWHGI